MPAVGKFLSAVIRFGVEQGVVRIGRFRQGLVGHPVKLLANEDMVMALKEIVTWLSAISCWIVLSQPER